jgi:hypothetical protein
MTSIANPHILIVDAAPAQTNGRLEERADVYLDYQALDNYFAKHHSKTRGTDAVSNRSGFSVK